ncbi:hypothetical protein [Phaeospirillum tilakii]|uniref:Uncharacterized protein n=1 Tax=Phaeospirillum tilakii TaxID=741673 RepID=A0ABW5CA24_9PROT
MSQPIVFVTYATARPVSMIGVLKRCLRLADRLHAEGHRIQMLHFGDLPHDGMVAEARARYDWHTPDIADSRPRPVNAWLERTAPALVVLGECPISGSMRTAFRESLQLGLRTACIDNYHSRLSARYFRRMWPGVGTWLLVGLPELGGFGWIEDDIFVAPPLVPGLGRRLPAPAGTLLLFGYDPEVARFAHDLHRRLPSPPPETVLMTGSFGMELAGGAPAGMRVVVSPGETAYVAELNRARVVVGKNGFQQMVEAVGAGAHMLCLQRPGGVPPELLPEHLQPYLRLTDGRAEAIEPLAALVSGWLGTAGDNPWPARLAELNDPVALAAAVLSSLLPGSPALAAAGGGR